MGARSARRTLDREFFGTEKTTSTVSSALAFLTAVQSPIGRWTAASRPAGTGFHARSPLLSGTRPVDHPVFPVDVPVLDLGRRFDN